VPDLVLDTDVIIELLRDNPGIRGELSRLRAGGWTLCYTPISKAEIYHGLRTHEEKATERFFTACRSLPVTDAVGEKAGRYLAAFHKSHGMELGDALIAAAAFVNDSAALFTLNRKHYPMRDIRFHVPGARSSN
jgi:hypothetical protein